MNTTNLNIARACDAAGEECTLTSAPAETANAEADAAIAAGDGTLHGAITFWQENANYWQDRALAAERALIGFDPEEARKRGISYFAERFPALGAALAPAEPPPAAGAAPEGWQWMRHPDWNEGKPIPVRIFADPSDGARMYQPFDFDGTAFEVELMDSDWKRAGLAATPSPEVAEQQGEREAFEAWFRKEYHDRLCRNMPDKSYNDPTAYSMWFAWQARAALASRAAPPAEQQGEARDWAKIESIVAEFIDGYEMVGETEDGRDACYTPNENERALLHDCIAGLLAEPEFVAALAAQQAPAQPAGADHDCGYERGSVLCRVCDLRQSNAGLTPQPAAPAQPPAKVDEREALTGWQDIETAPRLKGQRVLLLRDAGNGPFHAIGYALDGLPGWHSAECRGLETLEELGYRVTHWMPLPPAPTVAEKENGNG